MSFLATMEPQVFMYILSSISEGLTALGGNLNYFTGASHKSCLVFFFVYTFKNQFLFATTQTLTFLFFNVYVFNSWHAK